MAAFPRNMFEELQSDRQLLEVRMDEARILLPGGPIAIGTRNLNSCSVIVILGESAIILAHIAPLPSHSVGASSRRILRPGESKIHFVRILNRVRQLYVDNRFRFHNQTTAWGVFGVYNGSVAMPEHFELAQRALESWGLPRRNVWYSVARERPDPAAGTVIGVLQHPRADLYVEDQLKDSISMVSLMAGPRREIPRL